MHTLCRVVHMHTCSIVGGAEHECFVCVLCVCTRFHTAGDNDVPTWTCWGWVCAACVLICSDPCREGWACALCAQVGVYARVSGGVGCTLSLGGTKGGLKPEAIAES